MRLRPLIALVLVGSLGAAPRAALDAAPMSAALLMALQAEAAKAYPVKFVGVYDARDKQRRLQIMTGRTALAFRLSQAAVEGGRYTPKPDDQHDVLIVNCGAPDFGATFDCVAVTLKSAAGATIEPLSLVSGVNSYTNRLGATWTVREVRATYPISGLRQGFSVDYSSAGGVDFTKTVSATEADEDLLLRLEP